MSIFEKLKSLFSRNSIPIEEVEEFLLSKNFGVKFTTDFIEKLRENKKDYVELFKESIRESLSGLDCSVKMSSVPPTVFMFVGTNGSGKTTSIAKVAHFYKKQGIDKILLIAADTFRAGAIEQLSIWADRLGIDIVKGKPMGDPASVVFDGLTKGNEYELVLIDTSGRVETNENLLRELSKIEKVAKNKVGKIDEIFLVLDSLTGLNAFQQAEAFVQAVNITSIILTKFDTNSAPGVVIPIVNTYKIPIKFIGTGESIEDLEVFNADLYLKKLLGGTK